MVFSLSQKIPEVASIAKDAKVFETEITEVTRSKMKEKLSYKKN